MPRRKRVFKRELKEDERWQSILVSRLINKVMLKGKKRVAERIIYRALDEAAEKLKLNPLEALEGALKNVYPSVQLKSRRIGGANYRIPVEVTPERRIDLALRWVIAAARSRKGSAVAERLAEELVSAYNNGGAAVKKKEDTHRMAEANRAFARFARF